MARHPLQASVDGLVEYMTDALALYATIEARITQLVAERQDAGGTGAGHPGRIGKSLNRAVVVASVGALEAFCEDLVLTARDLVPGAPTAKSWFTIEGSRGMVQTPNSDNIAKMMWVHFRYDPRPAWSFLVTTAWSEVGAGTNWRGATKTYSGNDAAKALDEMVRVRHGFAHQDKRSVPKPSPGIVNVTSTGKLSLQSHHAFNSMSIVAQLAIQMTHDVAALLPGQVGKLRWKKAMKPLEDLLIGTPVATDIRAGWAAQPF